MIASEGEQKSAKALMEAARIMASSPSALQLRQLFMINDYDYGGGDDDEINSICNGCISDTCKLCTRSRLRRTAQLFSHCPWNSLEGSLTPR